MLSKFISVTIAEWLRISLGIDAQIKWPNDIVAGNKKIAGILIENVFKGSNFSHSIVGVGLNVNQENFSELPQASSLTSITGENYDCDQLLESYLNHLIECFEEFETVHQRYDKYLWRLGLLHQFKINEDLTWGVIRGINEEGQLVVKIEKTLALFSEKEIQFIY